MRRSPGVGASLAALALAASAAAAAEPAHRVATEHLVLEWVEDPGAGEVEAVQAEATALFESVAGVLGGRPEAPIRVVLAGPSERPDGRRDFPRVDSEGRVLLFKFVPDYRNYFTALAHELVHAFRIDRRPEAEWFFEEGFAEFVSLRADPSLAGFPWFDQPVTLVAGQWIARGEELPLTLLRERHRELNGACGAQAYALRSAFFDWLGRTFGDAAVLKAAQVRPAGALADYEKFFGKPLERLVGEWREALIADYRAIPDADARATAYRTESPIRYQKVCVAGEDF